MKRLIANLFLFLSLLLSAGGAAAAEAPPGPIHDYLRQGIEAAFNMDHAGATSAFQKAVDLDRDSPTGYAFLALAHLFSYEMSFDLKERERNQAEMVRYIG